MSLLGEGQTMNGTVLDSNSSQVTKLKKKTEGHSHKLYMDNFFSSKKFMRLDKETNLLWQCQAIQEGYARGPKTQESQTEMRGHSRKEQGRFDSSTIDGQKRCLHAE
jgi:hypothetical protein